MATSKAWTIDITVTDGTTPLAGVEVRGEVAGTAVGTIITNGMGRVRFSLSSPNKPAPLRVRAKGHCAHRTQTIDWSNPFFTLVLRPPWWCRLCGFLVRHVPETAKDWIFVLVVVLAVIYGVVCGLSWIVPGVDLFGYNARCARIAVERAARSSKPGVPPPAGYVINTVPIALEADVPQFLSEHVHVRFVVDVLRAAPTPSGQLDGEARAFNEAWMKYEQGVRDIAAKNEPSSAIVCPREEIETLRKLFDTIKGK